jgi:head-tail adaptor
MSIDQRIVLKRPVVASQDTYGGDVAGTPITIGTFWSEVVYQGGREFARAQQQWAETTMVFRIRRQPGLSYEVVPKDYVEWNNKTWDVTGMLGQGTRDAFWLIGAKDHAT